MSAAGGLPRPPDATPTPLIGLELGAGLVLALLAGGLFAWLGYGVLAGDLQATDNLVR